MTAVHTDVEKQDVEKQEQVRVLTEGESDTLLGYCTYELVCKETKPLTLIGAKPF